MKQVKYYFVLAAVALLSSCSNTNTKDNTTNSPDTAVLKEDTANELNANPVNDTDINRKETGEKQENKNKY